MADATTEAKVVSGRGSSLSRKSQKSGHRTPIQRINSASAYRRFPVVMTIQPSCDAGPVSQLAHHYQERPKAVKDALIKALEKDECGVKDPEVKTISDEDSTILVELLYRSHRSLLSVKEKHEESTTKLNEELKKIGVNQEIEVSIATEEELDIKLKQIR